MKPIDMSEKAISLRLKKVSQLRKLGIALKKGGKEKLPLGNNSNSNQKKT